MTTGSKAAIETFKKRLFNEAQASGASPLDSAIFFGKESVRSPETHFFIKLVGEGENRRALILKAVSPKDSKDMPDLATYFNTEPVPYDPKDKERDESGKATQKRDHADKHLVIMSGDKHDPEMIKLLATIKGARAKAARELLGNFEELQRYKNEALEVAVVRNLPERAQSWINNGANNSQDKMDFAIRSAKLEVLKVLYDNLDKDMSFSCDHASLLNKALENAADKKRKFTKANKAAIEKEREAGAAKGEELPPILGALAVLNTEQADAVKAFGKAKEVAKLVISRAPAGAITSDMIMSAYKAEVGFLITDEVIDALNPEEKTKILSSALLDDQVNLATRILERGADPRAHDSRGCTMLFNASSEEAMRMLLAKGAIAADLNNDGARPSA